MQQRYGNGYAADADELVLIPHSVGPLDPNQWQDKATYVSEKRYANEGLRDNLWKKGCISRRVMRNVQLWGLTLTSWKESITNVKVMSPVEPMPAAKRAPPMLGYIQCMPYSICECLMLLHNSLDRPKSVLVPCLL